MASRVARQPPQDAQTGPTGDSRQFRERTVVRCPPCSIRTATEGTPEYRLRTISGRLASARRSHPVVGPSTCRTEPCAERIRSILSAREDLITPAWKRPVVVVRAPYATGDGHSE